MVGMAQGPTGTVKGRTKESRHPPRDQGWTRRRWEWRLAANAVTWCAGPDAGQLPVRMLPLLLGRRSKSLTRSRRDMNRVDAAAVSDHFAFLFAMAMRETCYSMRQAMISRLTDERAAALRMVMADRTLDFAATSCMRPFCRYPRRPPSTPRAAPRFCQPRR